LQNLSTQQQASQAIIKFCVSPSGPSKLSFRRCGVDSPELPPGVDSGLCRFAPLQRCIVCGCHPILLLDSLVVPGYLTGRSTRESLSAIIAQFNVFRGHLRDPPWGKIKNDLGDEFLLCLEEEPQKLLVEIYM
jgi:hypothetical protein